MVAVRVEGARRIALVAAVVRRVGTDRKIVNDMAKEIRRAVKPIRKAIKVRAVEILPSGGGLGRWTARARITGQVRRGPTTAGVRIKGTKSTQGRKHDLRRLDLGTTRHPTFGNPPWHAQTVRPGFFTDAVTEEGLDQLEDAVIEAADSAVVRILNGIP